MSVVIWLAALLAGYLLFCRWLIFWRGEFREAYNPIIARLLRWRGMQAITLGPTCFKYSPVVMLTPHGVTHERFHYEEQQRPHWMIFFPRYLVLLAVYGYDKHPDEIAARAAAGESQ